MGFCNGAIANQNCYVDDFFIRGTYAGGCVNGKAHGYGEAKKAKVYYKGEFYDGKKHGKGVYVLEDGSKYEGEYLNDQRNGLGRFAFVRGNKNIPSWERDNDGFWQGNTYVVQGRFDGGNLDVKMTDEQYAQALQEKVEAKAKAERERLLAEQKKQEKAKIQKHLDDFRANLKGTFGKTTYVSPSGYKYEGEHRDGIWHGLGKLSIPNGNEELNKWQGQGVWHGDVYVVQGVFANGKLELECEPTKQACEKARIEKEKAEQVRLEQERKANEEACKSRYVGERLRLEAPYITTTFFIIPTTEYGYFPFEVKGVGKDRMTVQAVYQSGFNSQVESANVPCNTNKVY